MEREFITGLRSKISSTHANLRLGIGDDAAVLTPNASFFGDCGTVVTVDLLTEGVDFLLSDVDPVLIGRKALAVNLSDLAAMSAVPTAILIAVALPNMLSQTQRNNKSESSDTLALAQRIFQGIYSLAERYDVAIAGGDTNTWDGGLVISITALGRATEHGLLLRSGVRPGDRILVTGPLGGSILEHQFLFEPRVRESLFLNVHYDIHAAIDISDGLSLDLFRMLEASQEMFDDGILHAILSESAIPVSNDAHRLFEQEKQENSKKLLTPCEHALYDGEDFELLFTTSAATAQELIRTQPLWEPFQTTLYEIGEISTGAASDTPLFLRGVNGVVRELRPRGFLHGIQ